MPFSFFVFFCFLISAFLLIIGRFGSTKIAFTKTFIALKTRACGFVDGKMGDYQLFWLSSVFPTSHSHNVVHDFVFLSCEAKAVDRLFGK